MIQSLNDSMISLPWFIISVLSGSNSVVECDLAKVDVAGSTPVSRSRFFVPSLLLRIWTFSGRNANVRSRGAVPKW